MVGTRSARLVDKSLRAALARTLLGALAPPVAGYFAGGAVMGSQSDVEVDGILRAPTPPHGRPEASQGRLLGRATALRDVVVERQPMLVERSTRRSDGVL